MRLEVLIDLEIELLAIGIRIISNQCFVIESRIADSSRAEPLVHSHRQAVAVSVEKIVRRRHCRQHFGEGSRLVKCRRPLRVPRRTGWKHRQACVGSAGAVGPARTIRLGERASVRFHSAKNAETNQTARVRRTIGPGSRPKGFPCEINGGDGRIGLARCDGGCGVIDGICALADPSFPVAENSLPRFIRKNMGINSLTQVGDVLVPQSIEERFVLNNGTAEAHRVLMNVSPVRFCRRPRAVPWIDLPVVTPCVGVQCRVLNVPRCSAGIFVGS